MNKRALLPALLAGLTWAPSGGAAEFALDPDACVVFLGDVAAEQGTYADAVEAFVRVAYPPNQARFFRFWQVGATPRSLQQVFEQEVMALAPRPTHVVVCVGLNLVHMRAATEEVLSQFRAELDELVRRIKAEDMQVVLVTPPSADLNRNVRLKTLEFNANALGPIAAVVGEIASAQAVELVDWYAASLEQRAKRQETDANFSFSRDGLRPQAEGNALLAALLLEHWGAEPLRASITLDWAKAEVTSDRGMVTAERLGPDSIRLSFERFPVPWVLPTGRHERVSSQWYATRLCRFGLRVEGLPTSGLILEADRRSFPLVGEQLKEGFDLAGSELLTQAPPAMRLVQLINVKNKLFTQRWVDQEAKRPADEELTEAYQTLMKAYELYHAGYVRMIDKAAREMSLELTLKAVDVSDKSTLRGPTQPRRPRVRRLDRAGRPESGTTGPDAGTSGDEEETPPKDGRFHEWVE